MKRINYILQCFILAGLLLGFNTPSNAANVEFEQDYNFMAYPADAYSVHFDLLVWAYRSAGAYSHWAASGTAVYYSWTGNQDKDDEWYRLFDFWTTYDDGKAGKVFFKSHVGGKNSYSMLDNGQKKSFSGTDQQELSTVERTTVRKCQFLNIDWSPGEEFTSGEHAGKPLYLKVVVFDKNGGVTSDVWRTYYWNSINLLQDNIPQLMDPVFAPVGSSPKDAGLVMIPFMSVDPVVSYQSNQPRSQLRTFNDNMLGGEIWEKTQDRVISGYCGTFKVLRNGKDVVEKQSQKITIPAYHEIHNFVVKQAANGAKELSWVIKNATHQDAMDGDMFEIQRAFFSDYSDATNIGTVLMENAGEKDEVTYTFLDEDNLALNNPHNKSPYIYYRVRRASAAVWGWTGHNYAKSRSYKGRVTQIGLNNQNSKTKTSNTWCELEDKSKEKVDITGTFRWNTEADKKWVVIDPNVQLQVILTDKSDKSEIVIGVIPADSIHWTNATTAGFHFSSPLPKSCTNYSLRLKMVTDFLRADAPKVTSYEFVDKRKVTAIDINDLHATLNDTIHPEFTRLTWEADGLADYFIIERNNDTLVANFQPNASAAEGYWYNDSTAVPNVTYTYRVTSVLNCEGLKTISKTCIGCRYRYGFIEGHITYTTGARMAGVEVILQNNKTGKTIQTTTDADGYYRFDQLDYDLTGKTSYLVESTQNDVYSYYGPSEKSIIVILSVAHPVARNVDFLSSTYYRLTGRVLFSGTTIPVRDAYFLLSGNVVKSGADTLRTDATGNFSLTVPRETFTLQVAKEGHNFPNNGYLIINNKKEISLNNSLDGVRFWDTTRVRLFGRLVGGDIQGQKVLGFGESKNNLGDNLQLVLTLEGDNISHFVYDDKDLTKTTDSVVYKHRIKGQQTRVKMEEKRIIIYPDSITGEYEVKLPPVKYRIVQASAQGYATLFADGKTSETKDLTNSLTEKELKSSDSIYTDFCHDTYSVIYHAPAVVSVQQSRYSLPMAYFGEKTITRTTPNGNSVTVDLYDTDKGKYAFGYPVFFAGMGYGLHISAKEEYRYNNVAEVLPDVVPLGNYPVTIYNGLKNGTDIIRRNLSKEGTADLLVEVENVSYSAKQEEALKTLNVSVSINGQDVQAEPVQGFVLGSRLKQYDVMQTTKNDTTPAAKFITLNDILRDPPGSGSSAYLDKGSSYTSSYKFTLDFQVGLSLTKESSSGGVDFMMGKYLGTLSGGTAESGSMMIDQNFETTSTKTLPIFSTKEAFNLTWNWSYTHSTTERIQTSSEASRSGMGANANVYIGHTNNVYVARTENITVVDSMTLRTMQASVESGEAKVLMISQDGSFALITCEDIMPSKIRPVQFVYTQKHIVDHIIPTLIAEASKFIRTGTKEELQKIANDTREFVYYVDENSDSVCVFAPNVPGVHVVDKMGQYLKLIEQWGNILRNNEMMELNGTYGMSLLNSYSISAGTTVSYSENNSANSAFTFTPNGNQSADILSSGLTAILEGGGAVLQKVSLLNKIWDHFWSEKAYNDQPNTNTDDIEMYIKTSTQTTKLKFKPLFNFTLSGSQTTQSASSRNTGFTLSQNKDGYLDIDVYRMTDSVIWNKDSNVAFWRSRATTQEQDVNWSDVRNGKLKAADFIYVVRGGATRCPYIGERRTEFFRPGTLMDNPTIRMEQVKMEVANREVSGVPGDGAAVFDVTMWMETEASPGMDFGFGDATLSVSEGSNPNGALISIDGQPLTGAGRNFSFSRGKVLHKTIEVRRGTKAVDYNDIQLELTSNCDSKNSVTVKIAAHFLPVSCNVNILTPDDKWVMNTYSPNDKDGYYLPVTIDGYDPNYDNFDHIEFQYKLSTQSESNWVNLCSYYMDSTLYLKANGNKAYVAPSVGRIENIHFYGERDPMEQRYDLRAVSFCRYGTGFITKASNVVSGIKDTRRPELFGVVSPANGVLTKEDYIHVPFSEPIAGNYLDEDNNFQVIGFKNKNDYFSRPSLYFDEDGYIQCPISRDLSKTSLTIDMVVLPDQGQNPQDVTTYFVHGNSEHRLEFGQTRDNRLFAMIQNGKNNKKTYVSDTIGSMQTFTRVAMVYDRKKQTIAFYVGSKPIGKPMAVEQPYAGNGIFGLGTDAEGDRSYVGRMTDVRIWSKALTLAEIGDTYQKVLTGSEKGLLVFYPMDEGRGKTIEDKAHGANAQLVNMSWNVPEGLALQLSGSPVELKPEWFNRGITNDFTFSMWFKAGEDSKNSLIFGNDNIKNDSSTANVAIMLDENGQLIVKQNGTLTAGGNYADGEWHCLSIVVNRGLNSTQLFVDDKVMAREDGSFFREWAFDRLYIGKNFYGTIDDISMWDLAMPDNYLKSFYTHAPNGKEMGLACYLPFSRRELNDNGVYETHFSRYNAALHQDKTSHQWFERLDTVVISSVPEQMQTQSGAPVCKSNEYEKMNFSWVAQDNDLVINLKMPDAEINKQTVFFSLRDVEDLQGNRLLNPIVWSTYVDRNSLRWLESQIWMDVDYGKEMKFTIKADNQTGRRISYRLENMPDWLTSDVYINTVQPMGEEEFEFTISGELTPGDYFAMPTLTDDEGLSDQLFIFVTVNAPQPTWAMPLNLDQSMNLIGKVLLNTASIGGSYIDTDPRDIVGAFYGKTCIGKGNISGSPTGDANLYMKIYANQKLLEKPMPITMRLWQASTGKTFTLKTEDGKDLQFEKDAILGSAKNPIVFTMVERQVQNIPVTQGWNWLSFYVQPGEINASFITPGAFSNYEQIKVPLNKGGIANYYATKGWDYTPKTFNATPFNPMDYHLTYMYYRSSKDIVLEVEGGNISPNKRTIELVQGWNYLPYLLDYNENIDAALSDYYDKASEGDFVNGYTRFAIFDGEHWMGTLQTLYAGEGYMLLRKAKNAVKMTYFSHDVHSAPARISNHSDKEVRSRGDYATNMPIVAQVVADSATMIESLTAYANGQFAGEATPIVQADGSTLWFLSASAMEGSRLTFVVNEENEGRESSTTIPYAAFAPAGDLRNPLLIRFDDAPQKPEKVMINGILYIRRNGKIYTAQGALQNDEQIMNY